MEHTNYYDNASNNNVRSRWNWSDNHLDEVQEIIRDNAKHLMSISIASNYADTRRATDLNIEFHGGEIAVRVRDSKTKYRDFTIRSSSPPQFKSEFQKIQDGFCDFYFYAWASGGHIDEWMLIDVQQLRESGLLERSTQRTNLDGSTFRFISANDLNRKGCVLVHSMTGMKQ